MIAGAAPVMLIVRRHRVYAHIHTSLPNFSGGCCFGHRSFDCCEPGPADSLRNKSNVGGGWPPVADLRVSCKMNAGSTEKSLAGISLWIAIGGAIWGLFVLFATGMSNVQDDGRRGTFLAFPAASLAFLLSVVALILALRRGTLGSCARATIAALIISACTLLLAYAALRSYS